MKCIRDDFGGRSSFLLPNKISLWFFHRQRSNNNGRFETFNTHNNNTLLHNVKRRRFTGHSRPWYVVVRILLYYIGPTWKSYFTGHRNNYYGIVCRLTRKTKCVVWKIKKKKKSIKRCLIGTTRQRSNFFFLFFSHDRSYLCDVHVRVRLKSFRKR